MEISVEIKRYEQTFRTTIAGVTKQNPDGTERQALIKTLSRGEAVRLVREPNNPYDKYAVAVFRTSGEQLGYIPAGDRRLADHMDMSGHVSAKAVKIVGGPGILGLFFRAFRKHYGCVIEISKGDFNWKEVLPYTNESRKIEELIKTAQTLEAKDAAKAISMYREAITQIVEFDSAGAVKAAWRRARYPVNRLSLLLEKRGELRKAQEVILMYEQFSDAFGLTSTEKKSVDARKQRLARKLNA
jgi:HIRAN domain